MAKKNIKNTNLPYLPNKSGIVRDLNTIKETGIYRSAEAANTPHGNNLENSGGIIIVLSWQNTGYFYQIYFMWNDLSMWIRYFHVEKGWLAWKRLAFNSEIPTIEQIKEELQKE